MKINIWESHDELYGYLKSSKSFLNHVDDVLLKLIDSVIDDMKTDSFDELMDYLEESTTEDLLLLYNHIDNDDRLLRCVEIFLNKK
tara:strand:- start:69 stop:326 length:258 start_codon:yes stop_codon:yes gene_type:complete